MALLPANDTGAWGLLLQQAVVVLAVSASAAYVLHARTPQLSRRLRLALAIPLVREARPAWIQRLGRWVAPAPAASSGCGACSACDRPAS